MDPALSPEKTVRFNVGTKNQIETIYRNTSPWHSAAAFRDTGYFFQAILSLEAAASTEGKVTLLVFTDEQKAAFLSLPSAARVALSQSTLLSLSRGETATDVELFDIRLRGSSCKKDFYETAPFAPVPLKLPFVFSTSLNKGVPPTNACVCGFTGACVNVELSAVFRSVSLPAAPPASASASSTALLARLLGGLLSDVTLRVQQKELRSHRCVLAAVSDVFRAMLEDARFLESATGVVEIEDVRAEVMEAALRHCYGQELGVLDGGTLSDLLVLSERYQLLELKALCGELLAKDQSLDALQLLALADTHNAHSLKQAVVSRIVRSSDRSVILTKASALAIVRSNPEVFVDLVMKLV